MDKDKNIVLSRIYGIYFLMFVIGVLIIWKAANIQIVEGPEWREKAEKVLLRYEHIEPIRGNIYSSDGNLLAVSLPVFEIRIDAANTFIDNAYFSAKIDSLSHCLSRLFGDKPAKQYKDSLTKARQSKNRYYLLKRNVTYPQLKQLRTFPILNLGKFKGGLIVIKRTRRELPFRNLAYRTIGWDKPGSENDVGMEGAYSDLLCGTAGKQLLQKIGNGHWRPLNDEFEIEPQNGHDIISCIDVVLQDVANEALRKQLVAQDADQGCAVLMEVHTGHIKAIANLSRNSNGNFEERFNFAIAESSEPGSTFKLASVIAALEDKVTDTGQIIHTGNGVIKYANREMRDTKAGGYGPISLKRAFEVSSNVGISKAIYDNYNKNPETFIARLHGMSLNNSLGIEIAGEGAPYIKQPTHRTWSKVSLPWMSVGYELKITPLQTLTFYNAVANGGCMVKPMFVKEFRQSGITIEKFEPTIINPAIASKGTIAKAQAMLLGVVENGTASHLKNSSYKIAGKTGTAQIAVGNQGYNKSNYKASFVGYFPADDPKYSCIVVINNPKKEQYYGGAIAAPVFKEIADRVYAYDIRMQPRIDTAFMPRQEIFLSGYHSDLLKDLKRIGYSVADPISGAWATANTSHNAVYFDEYPMHTGEVPDVRGMTARDAIFLLEKCGFIPKAEGKGLVIKQIPEAGSTSDSIKEIVLQLAISSSK